MRSANPSKMQGLSIALDMKFEIGRFRGVSVQGLM